MTRTQARILNRRLAEIFDNEPDEDRALVAAAVVADALLAGWLVVVIRREGRLYVAVRREAGGAEKWLG